MIFYSLRQWLASWTKLIFWLDSSPISLEENCEGRVDGEIEVGKVWRVWHLATFWAARADKKETFNRGDYIRVVRRKGLVLFIEHVEPNEE